MLMMSGLLRAGVLILTMIEPCLARRRKCRSLRAWQQVPGAQGSTQLCCFCRLSSRVIFGSSPTIL